MDQETNKESQLSEEASATAGVTLEEKLKSLMMELEEVKREREQFKGALQRAQADLANYRRQTEEERGDQLKFANGRLLIRLIPMLDDFNLALGQPPDGPDKSAWMEGLRLVHRKLHTIIESEGVTRIEALGKAFDPLEHEAMAQQESSDHEDGHVLAVIQDGYKLHGRVLRPARVIVAKKVPTTQGSEERKGAKEEREG
jgi:molecular chaperone GrpE